MEKVCEAVLMEIDIEKFRKAMAEIDIEEARYREKIREAASAHCEELTEEQQEAARKFFETMDTDKSGNISVDEFMTFLSLAGLQTDNHDWLFAELDKDNNGTLDFKELVPFFYVLSRDEYKHLLKCTPNTDAPDQKGKTWNMAVLSQAYYKLKDVYKLDWKSESECSIV